MLKSIVAFAIVMGLSSTACAFLKLPEGGVYTLRCQSHEHFNSLPYDPDTGTWELSFVRIDNGANEELARGQVDANGMFQTQVTIPVTSGVDAEIVCFAIDKSGNVSDRSEESAIVDFTPPGKPVNQE